MNGPDIPIGGNGGIGGNMPMPGGGGGGKFGSRG